MTDAKPDRPDNPGVIAPPPLIALATLALGLLLDWLLPAYVLTVLLSFWTRAVIAVLLLAAGAALGFSGVRMFQARKTNVPPWQPALNLAMGGVYAHMRNPMYVGMALLTAGVAFLLASDWTLVLLIPAALLLHYGVVLREERYLDGKFCDEYRRYKASTPRYGWPV